MQNIIEKCKNKKKIKLAAIIAFVVVMVMFSFFCIKRYIKNSQIVQYDLNTFTLYDGYEGGVENGSFVIRAGSNEGKSDFCSDSLFTLLDKGVFTIGIEYQSDLPTVAFWQAGDSIYEQIDLPAGQQTVFHDFTLDQSVEDARIRIKHPGEGEIRINTFVIMCDRPIVTDWIMVLAIGWGLVFVLLMYIHFMVTKRMTKEHLMEIGFVVLVSVLSIPYIILMKDGIIWGYDTVVHNMRVEGIKDALLGGQFPVVIAPSMCNGYGSIEPIMYPSLFLYPLAILRILGISPVMVYKLAHVIINLFMCSTCYVCVKKITRSIPASCLSLLVFAFSGYHLFMIGHKDWTYGMGLSMTFMFISIIGLYEIIMGNGKVWPYITFGMWGLMNTHILSTLFMVFIVLVFSLAFIKKLIKENRLQYLIKASITAIPLCLYRIYTFLDAFINNELNTGVLNLGIYETTTSSIKQFITDADTLLPVVVVIIGIAFVIINKRLEGDVKHFIYVCIATMLVCLICMSSYLPWEAILTNNLGDKFFGYIQFASRILQIIIPLAIIVFGIVVKYCLKDGKACVAVICVAVFALSVYSYSSEIGILSSTKTSFVGKITGDVLSFPGMDDYVPEGENGESYSGRVPYLSSDNISIDYDTYEKNGVRLSCEVECTEDGSYIDFPLFGYKGYVCSDEQGNAYETGVGEHHRLRVYVDKAAGAQTLHINYKVSPIYTILQILSYVSMFVLITLNADFLGRVKARTGYYDILKKNKLFFNIMTLGLLRR